MTDTQVKIWTKTDIQQMLETRDIAVTKALVLIYNKQTAAEQSREATVENNGIGFTGVDGEILTSFAKFYMRAGQCPGEKPRSGFPWRTTLQQPKAWSAARTLT